MLHASEPFGRADRAGREWKRLDADGGQSAARLLGKGAQGAGDIGKAAQSGQSDGEVSQTSHHGRSVADADAGVVFGEGDIADIVGAVLNPPLAAVEGEELARISLRRWQGGDGEDGFVASFAGLQFGDRALDATDLCDIREVDVVVEGRGGEQTAVLQAAVALIEGLGAPGGKQPGSVP